jgi:hypothetical protein
MLKNGVDRDIPGKTKCTSSAQLQARLPQTRCFSGDRCKINSTRGFRDVRAPWTTLKNRSAASNCGWKGRNKDKLLVKSRRVVWKCGWRNKVKICN